MPAAARPGQQVSDTDSRGSASAGTALGIHDTGAWQAMWQGLPAPRPDPGLHAQLLLSYAEPHRKYHSTEHLQACLKHFARLRDQAEHPHEVLVALWFHDAIYAIGSSDNELRSAQWARSALLDAGASADCAQRVFDLVMVTRHDQAPGNRDQQVLLDIDLSILGQTTPVFDAYEQQIAEEFAAVPSAQRRTRRRQILQRFLDRPRIFHTNRFHDLLEARARANLQRSILQLQDP